MPGWSNEAERPKRRLVREKLSQQHISGGSVKQLRWEVYLRAASRPRVPHQCPDKGADDDPSLLPFNRAIYICAERHQDLHHAQRSAKFPVGSEQHRVPQGSHVNTLFVVLPSRVTSRVTSDKRKAFSAKAPLSENTESSRYQSLSCGYRSILSNYSGKSPATQSRTRLHRHHRSCLTV